MDLYEDNIFNDQSLQFSPLRLSPSPEPFTSIMVYLLIIYSLFLISMKILWWHIYDNKTNILALWNIKDILQDPVVEETDNVGEEIVGLINNSAINEANLLMSEKSPDLISLPETLTLVQHPLEVVCYLHFF